MSKVTLEQLDAINVDQQTKENFETLGATLGGLEGFMSKLNITPGGLTDEQVVKHREEYGENVFPAPPEKTWLSLFYAAVFEDTVVVILCIAALVSFIIGLIEDPAHGWIEGVAITIAVLLVGTVTATNDYNKEKQFRALEAESAKNERVFVKRNNVLHHIDPTEIVVGDLIKLKAGDGIPADALLYEGVGVKCNESALTGEPDDLLKSYEKKDPFLLSSCTVTDQGTSPEVLCIAIAVGSKSRWGKIRANLQEEQKETPLQEKLNEVVKLISYIGTGFAVLTFVVLAIYAFIDKDATKKSMINGIVDSFIIAVTVVVVAIPEGLPLAVTISLAYSTKKMYRDQNLIRVLAACETMGNATNICSDKTGTLTENRMTVVEGYFGEKVYSDLQLEGKVGSLNEIVKMNIAENVSVNSAANVIFTGEDGAVLHKPKIIGSATEGALLLMVNRWDMNFETIKTTVFNKDTDMVFPFNSSKKRSTCIVKKEDGSVRVFVKGATEWLLKDATKYVNGEGEEVELTENMRNTFNENVDMMANKAYRTLCIAHIDFESEATMPEDWQNSPPDDANLVVDGIVGLEDPLRTDVKDAVKTAQNAGVLVRMVTGDNIKTAMAIARQCGILTTGSAIEGPEFRNMTPSEVDKILPNLQVMARSSPEDKYLLVTRLNGANLPKTEQEWLEKHPGRDWKTEKDNLMPGYYDEWVESRKNGGEVVGVTGDGTNDAPALKAADVGLSMGITGTQVAKNASDIVILDDKFSSIVNAIKWGRCVYDNIRKFIQFQLTVNVVALVTVLVGALCGFDPPFNAVMMLWVNLIMDTMGALALGTEDPTDSLLERKPYIRSAAIVSYPMWRNIFGQSTYQLIFTFILLFKGPQWFDLNEGNYCREYYPEANKSDICKDYDFTHFTFMFNAFVWAQIFNEFNSRELFHDLNVWKGLETNPVFLAVIVFTILLQWLIVDFGGYFLKTTAISAKLWGVSIAFGAGSWIVAALLKLIYPVPEKEADFAGYADAPKNDEDNKEEKGIEMANVVDSV